MAVHLSADSRRRLRTLQSLRALAAVLVATGHVLNEPAAGAGARAGLGWLPWAAGVDIFFVISGAVIVISAAPYLGQPGAVRRFVLARLIRVVPLYWLATAAMLAAVLLLPGRVRSAAFEPLHALASFFFWPHLSPIGTIYPLLAQGWTLNNEMFFYAAFAALMVLFTGTGAVVAALSLLFGGLAAMTVFGPQAGLPLAVWADPIILEFVAGAAIGWLHVRRGGRGGGGGWLAMAGGFALLVLAWPMVLDGTLPRWLGGGLPAAAMVAGAVLGLSPREDRRTPAAAVRLGDSSYALYLTHSFVARTMTILWAAIMPAGSGALYVAVTVLAALAGSHLVWSRLEEPLLARLRHRLLRPSGSVPASPPPLRPGRAP